MRCLKFVPALLILSAVPASTLAQQPTAESQVVDKIIAQEQVEVQMLRQYAPLVETYIQILREDKRVGSVPESDKYFLGRAVLAKGVDVEPLTSGTETKHNRFLGGIGNFFGTEYLPQGFLQMIYVDLFGFNKVNYTFEYVRREFLGDVRCLVFDVDPIRKNDKGRFVGRIWVEDQDFHIVRFNGAYGGSSLTSNYFNFDSWRANSGKNQWLPAFIYSQLGDVRDAQTKRMGLKPLRAQTRLWGYDLGHSSQEQELNKVLVEAAMPVKDETAPTDFSPLQSERSWSRQAEDNVADSLERLGLLAPAGPVDKALETVVNNLEITNNLSFEPEVRCRVLMISTLESFSIGHTIVLSRGLVDVLPDEASLAIILSHELGHVVLGHRMDMQFAFLNKVRFDERETFRHFGFAHTPDEEQAANQKGTEILKNSPYQSNSGTARLFLQALKDRAKEIPNLISPHLGNRVPGSWSIVSAVFSAQAPEDKPAADTIVALPLGSRIKIEPWNDHLQLLKSGPHGAVAEAERMPFEITPFMFYLTRQGMPALPKVDPITASAAAEAAAPQPLPPVPQTQPQP